MDTLASRNSATRLAAIQTALAIDDDHRFAPRRKGQIPALIQFDHMTDAIPCIVRDMSASGARIEVRAGWEGSLGFSSNRAVRLRLIIRHDRTLFDCRIVRHSETEIGVKFLSAPQHITFVGR